MMTPRSRLAAIAAAFVGVALTAPAAPGSHFGIGLTYVSGMNDIVDQAELVYRSDDSTTIPVGLSFQYAYEYDFGGAVCANLAPLSMILLDGDVEYYDVPLAVSYRHMFIAGPVSPYARAGLAFHVVGGDLLADGQSAIAPGIVLGGGVEFMRNRAVGIGIDLAYDATEVDLKGKDGVAAQGVSLSIRAIF